MLRFIVRVLNKLKLLKYINVSIRVEDINIPILGGIGYTNIYGTEKWMNTIMSVLVKNSKGCILDIGVNLGQTLIKVKKADPDFDYIGFEPNPICVFYTEKLVAANRLNNVRIVPAGVAGTTGIVTLKYFSADQTDSSASIIDNFRPEQKVFAEKSIVVLNDEIASIEKKIGIIKIDVEGAELYVMQGLIKYINRDRPIIAIEILPVYKKENEERLERQRAIEELLKEEKYSILKIIKNNDDTFKSVQKINEIGIHSDLSHCDYLFVPVEEEMDIMMKFGELS